MDKHDRPYKCDQPGCESREGFTYSGGLHRHQREVHKMHMAARRPLFCPFPNCSRSSGAGFTRRENLEEHKRRRHLGELDLRPPWTNTSDSSLSAELSMVSPPSGKRKLMEEDHEDDESEHEGGKVAIFDERDCLLGDSIRHTIRRLQAEIARKNDIIDRQNAELEMIRPNAETPH